MSMAISPDLVARRRAFRLPGYATLADVKMDGEYVSPLQMMSNSPTGPVLLAYHWSDVETLEKNEGVRECGYLKGSIFNKVVDRALQICGMKRADVYMTQVFHLLPLEDRSAYVPPADLDASFAAITRYELEGRKVIAMGGAAAGACARGGITPLRVVSHPSARSRTVEAKAAELADAIRAASEVRDPPFALTLPRWLMATAERAAERDGVSLNH